MAFGQQELAAGYGTEPKRMRLSGAAAAAAAAAAGSSTTTRASTGAPTAMTNKGSVYKAQRGRGERAGMQRRGGCFGVLRARGFRVVLFTGVSFLGALASGRTGNHRAMLRKYADKTEVKSTCSVEREIPDSRVWTTRDSVSNS